MKKINTSTQCMDMVSKILLRTSHQLRCEPGRINIISGRLKGLKLKYEADDYLTISSYGSWISVDSTEQFSWRNLLRLLVIHQFVG